MSSKISGPERALRNSDIDYLIGMLSCKEYVRTMRFNPFPWQDAVLGSRRKRKIILAARQSGKSTIVSTRPCHKAKYKERSLSVVLAATEKQAVEDMEKIKGFIQSDTTFPQIVRSSDSLIKLENDSRIVVVPATEKAARGYSKPDFVLLDEASRIDDIVYTSGIKPMFTDNPDGELDLLSTPAGKIGFFFEIWDHGPATWEKYMIRSPWQPKETDSGLSLVQYMQEAAFVAKCKEKGIHYACFSPRHMRFEEQLENLMEMGSLMYRQEYCCEFVETVDTVFSYDEIRRLEESLAAPMVQRVIGGDAMPADLDFSMFERF